MALRSALLILILLVALVGQVPDLSSPDYVCPMDRDVHSPVPGNCPRCGMKLVLSLPEPKEYPVDLTVTPKAFKVGQDVTLMFRVLDPSTGKPVNEFETVHEKLFHLFIVSRDLMTFQHDHPVLQPDGSFTFVYRIPQGGEYRLLCDFYPKNATPQLIAKTMIAPGSNPEASLHPDLAPKRAANLEVALRTEPEQPIAGMKTRLFFNLTPNDRLEPYLGAWGHMLIASADLIDMIHTHPTFGTGTNPIQFDVIFPRPGIHRVWVQFQRAGTVNTTAFNVPVSALK